MRLRLSLGAKDMAKKTRTSRILADVGHEIKTNPPSVLSKTRRKKGAAAAEAQRKAILLSKARERGAEVPKPKKS